MDTRVIALLVFAAVFTGTASGTSWLESGLSSIISSITNVNSTQEELYSDVLFNLFTPSNPDTAELLYLNDSDAITNSNFDTSLPTRIVVHGWNNNYTSSLGGPLLEAYLNQGDYNVILVDWSAYALKDYLTAREKIVCVGAYIGEMIDSLVDQGMDIDSLIVIGHSLGAHISGVACRSASNAVPVLLGLDPAGPLFYDFPSTATMTSEDADYVQVIHTNAGVNGYGGDLGDADFWVNGGTIQPGCGLDLGGSCAHARVFKYLVESISGNSTSFVAKACSSFLKYSLGGCASADSTYMGGVTVDTTTSGDYYLNTNSASLYAQG